MVTKKNRQVGVNGFRRWRQACFGNLLEHARVAGCDFWWSASTVVVSSAPGSVKKRTIFDGAGSELIGTRFGRALCGPGGSGGGRGYYFGQFGSIEGKSGYGL